MAVGYCLQTPAHLLVAQSGACCVFEMQGLSLWKLPRLPLDHIYVWHIIVLLMAWCSLLPWVVTVWGFLSKPFFLSLHTTILPAPLIPAILCSLSVLFLSPILLLLILSFQADLLFLVFISCLFCVDPLSSHANCVNCNVLYLGRTRGGQHTALMAYHSRNAKKLHSECVTQHSGWAAIRPGKRRDLHLINEAGLGLLEMSGGSSSVYLFICPMYESLSPVLFSHCLLNLLFIFQQDFVPRLLMMLSLSFLPHANAAAHNPRL